LFASTPLFSSRRVSWNVSVTLMSRGGSATST
jgi:hypothetical protein